MPVERIVRILFNRAENFCRNGLNRDIVLWLLKNIDAAEDHQQQDFFIMRYREF